MTDLATALRHELARLAATIDRLVADLAIATGRPEAVVRLSVGLDGENSCERAVSGDDRGQSRPDRPSSTETGERP